MELTELQKKLVQEMIEQGGDEYTINGIMSRLKIEKQQEKMLDYLIKTKHIPVPTGKIILKSIEIKKMNSLKEL
jgi:hypothetical protein